MQCLKNILGRQWQGLIPLLKGTRYHIFFIYIYNFFAHHSRATASSVSKTSSSSSLETPSTTRKHKDPFEQVQELTATYTNSHLESERVWADSKHQRLEHELNIQQLKSDTEDQQHQHKAEECECQCQHELQMMEKQIILAKLHAGNMNMGNPNTAHVQTGLGYENYSQGF